MLLVLYGKHCFHTPKGIPSKESKFLIRWIPHPEDPSYEYSEDVNIRDGHPLKNVETGVVTGIVNNTGVTKLTVEDKDILRAIGLKTARS